MRWVEIVYGATMGACAWLAGANLLIWLRDRRALAQLFFSIATLSVMALAGVELRMMQLFVARDYADWFRWFHLAGYGALVGSVGFVHHYFGAGRRWLAVFTVIVGTAVLVPNFFPGANNSFESVEAVQRVLMWGQRVTAIAHATPSVMMYWVEFTHICWWWYMLDSSVRLWRRNSPGDRRRAWVIGAPAVITTFVAAVLPTLLYFYGVRWPLVMSLSFTYGMVAIGFELSEDVVRASRTARELMASRAALRDSEQRLELAMKAAALASWEWDVARDEVWIDARGREFLSASETEEVDRQRFLGMVHPADRAGISELFDRLAAEGGVFEREYRHVRADGAVRWIFSRGSAERDASGSASRVRGVSVDVTDRVTANEALAVQRRELAHLLRVAMLGELSGSLAHELNQPLASILSNAQTAQRLVEREPLDRAEMREILADIVLADSHAAEVIRRVRGLLNNGAEQRVPVDLNQLVTETLRLMRIEFRAQAVEVKTDLQSALPSIVGDRVHLQQVLLNLAVNACDAMSMNNGTPRRLLIRTRAVNGREVDVAVCDTSPGIPPDVVPRIFEPFLTTKPQGLGLGLSVCRTIIAAHGGRLTAVNNPDRGSTFRFTLPVSELQS